VDISSVVLAADSLGAVAAGQLPVVITAYARVAGIADSGWTWTRTSTVGITTTISGAAVTITAMSAGLDSGIVTITGTKSGSADIVIVVSVVKAKGASPSTGPVSSGGATFASQFASGISATAEVSLNADGRIQERVNGGSYVDRGRWFLGTVSGSFTVIADLSGSTLSSGTVGLSQSLGTTRSWVLTQAPAPSAFKVANLTLRIYNSSSDLVATVTWRLQAEYES
jgi:hypothetical protein